MSLTCRGQFYNLPENYLFSKATQQVLAEKDASVHAGLQPYVPFFSKKYQHLSDSHLVFRFIHEDPAVDFLFYNHFIQVAPKNTTLKLRIDPLLNFELGKDLADTNRPRLLNNTRGIIASGEIGDRFYFETLFAENQSYFPDYIRRSANSSAVVPGQGRWKTFKTVGYDYAFSSGHISMLPAPWLNVQVGHGKHKVGNGYRSLLWSDNAFNYPYARITQNWFGGRVQYTNLYAVLMNLRSASAKINPNTERLFQKKCAAFQQLSVNVNSSVNLGFFQSLIWKNPDSKNRQNLDARYFNPLIYSNLAAFGLDNQNNLLCGLDLKAKLTGRLALYAQAMLDRLDKIHLLSSGFGYQCGIDWFDPLGAKGLRLKVEYNYSSPNAYSTGSAPIDDHYSHYGQSLGPATGNGSEALCLLTFQRHRVFLNAEISAQEKSNDSQVLFGSGQVGYLVNRAYNLNVCLGFTARQEKFYNFKSLNNQTSYLFIGLRTSIYNLYYDF